MNRAIWKWLGQVSALWLWLGLSACPKHEGAAKVAAPERVIVVGAGVSGLTAAHALTRAGIDCVVLEARERIGGRIVTEELDGAWVDLGAAWLHSARGNPLAELIDAWDLPRKPYEGDFARVWDTLHGRLDARELEWGYAQFEEFSALLPDLRKQLGPEASVHEGVDRFMDLMAYDGREARLVRFIIEEAFVENEYAAPPDELSLRYFLEDATFAGSDWVLDGGYTKLVERLAEKINLRLGERVTRIEYGDFGVRVHGTSGVFAGSHVIVTVSLGVLKAGAIAFDPPLPEPKRAAIARLAMGNLEKVVLRYDEAFWTRDRGRIFAYLGEPLGRYPGFIDMSEFAGAPTLVAYYGGAFARAVQADTPDTQIRDDALSVLGELLAQSLPEPRAVSVTHWTRDPFSLGSYSFVPAGVTPDDRQVLAEPVAARVLFAGEASSEYASTVHGAYLSGLREAERLGVSAGGLPGGGGKR